MAGLERFHFHITDESAQISEPTRRGMRSASPSGAHDGPGFANDEAAARFHLSRLLGSDARAGVRGVTSPERSKRVPDLEVVDTQQLPGTETRLVRFAQTRDSIPVFGAHAVCELTGQRGLVSASGRVGKVENVSSFPSVSQDEARASIARFANLDDPRALDEITPGKLNFFQDDAEIWHLVWLFERVPAAPPQIRDHARGHGLGGSPRTRRPLIDYLVDAHEGDVVYYFSATPLLDALPVPVRGSGTTEDGSDEPVWGRMVGGEFELSDPQREIETHDLAGGDIDSAMLAHPFRAASSNLGGGCRGLASAHVNATKVYDFYRVVLQRDSIDNAGMNLVNVVNVTSAADEPPPTWHNAVWWENRMWYGQAPGDGATLISFARFLDVIAHELTHGVTEHTCNLVYKNQSGALNESFSDIFGVMVKNWDYHAEGGEASAWDWEIGAGLGGNGLPLRDLSDPTRTGDPAHMDDYVRTLQDEGGVHINSNIHNKAAYNLLMSADESGERRFTPREVALLYYHALVRLGRMDGFRDTLTALVDVASTMYGGDPATRDAKVAAIREAYAAVGIT
jgi:bacillolysin